MISDAELQAKRKGRTWNLRAVRFEHGDDSHVAVHEVHYEGDKPIAYSETPAVVLRFEVKGPDTGSAILERMREALQKPVLAEADFNKPRRGEVQVAPEFAAHQARPETPAGYEPDEGPLSRYELVAIERDAKEHLPKGKTLKSASLEPKLSAFDPGEHGGEVGFGAEVGRERFWLLSPNRYPVKKQIKLRKIALGPARPAKGTREAKLANMRRQRKKSLREQVDGVESTGLASLGRATQLDSAEVPLHRTPIGIEYVALADVPAHMQEPLWLHLLEASGRLIMQNVGRACLVQDWLAWLKTQEADRAKGPA